MMKELKLDIFELCVPVMVFIILFAPSLKIIYSSPLLNIVPVVFLTFFLCFKQKWYCPNDFDLVNKVMLSYFIISIPLLFLGIGDISTEHFKIVFIYYSIIVAVYSFRLKHLKLFMVLIIIWGGLLALYQLLIGIILSAQLGQTYLTISIPLGVAFTISIVSMFFVKSKFSRLSMKFAYSLIVLFALGTLLNRSALLISIAVLLIVFVISIIFDHEKSKIRKLGTLLVLLGASVIISYLITDILNERQMDRIIRLLDNIEDEPRMLLYYKSFEYFLESPIYGYGIGNATELFNGGYPHNIFLDILLNGGLILLTPFMIIIYLFFQSTKSIFGNRKMLPEIVGLFAVATYLLFQWNISFGFDTSQIPIISMLIFIKALYEHNQNKSGDLI
jgi:O-antigen ligase